MAKEGYKEHAVDQAINNGESQPDDCWVMVL